MDCAAGILLFLIFEAIRRPGESFEAGGFNWASTYKARSVGAVFKTAQSILNLFQRLRHNSAFFEYLRCALGCRGVIGRVSAFAIPCKLGLAFEASEIGLEFTFLLTKLLFEVFGVHEVRSILSFHVDD